MIEVTAEVGGLEVVASGLLHVYGKSIEAKVNGMDMQIVFISEGSPNDTKFATEVVGSKLVLKLQNFFSPFPEGQIEPTVMGVINGRSLLMAFSVVTVDKDNDARLFSYTFYLGAEK